ncbi:unnamed protein product [Amoebophrya sp. A25]|nr:unnamed protein product [Amoebophrya sp. A25]|eukprot:GSA25T00010705001.1
MSSSDEAIITADEAPPATPSPNIPDDDTHDDVKRSSETTRAVDHGGEIAVAAKPDVVADEIVVDEDINVLVDERLCASTHDPTTGAVLYSADGRLSSEGDLQPPGPDDEENQDTPTMKRDGEQEDEAGCTSVKNGSASLMCASSSKNMGPRRAPGGGVHSPAEGVYNGLYTRDAQGNRSDPLLEEPSSPRKLAQKIASEAEGQGSFSSSGKDTEEVTGGISSGVPIDTPRGEQDDFFLDGAEVEDGKAGRKEPDTVVEKAQAQQGPRPAASIDIVEDSTSPVVSLRTSTTEVHTKNSQPQQVEQALERVNEGPQQFSPAPQEQEQDEAPHDTSSTGTARPSAVPKADDLEDEDDLETRKREFAMMSPSRLQQAMSPHLQQGNISASELAARLLELRNHHRAGPRNSEGEKVEFENKEKEQTLVQVGNGGTGTSGSGGVVSRVEQMVRRSVSPKRRGVASSNRRSTIKAEGGALPLLEPFSSDQGPQAGAAAGADRDEVLSSSKSTSQINTASTSAEAFDKSAGTSSNRSSRTSPSGGGGKRAPLLEHSADGSRTVANGRQRLTKEPDRGERLLQSPDRVDLDRKLISSNGVVVSGRAASATTTTRTITAQARAAGSGVLSAGTATSTELAPPDYANFRMSGRRNTISSSSSDDDDDEDDPPPLTSKEFHDLVDQNLALVDWDREDGMGVKTAIYTLTGSIVGAGAVSCPFAFQFMGFFGGLALLAFLGFLSGYSGYLLGMAARKTGLHSYEEIAVTTMGAKSGKALALCSVIGVTFSAAIAYGNLWADTMLPILETVFGLNPEETMRGTETCDVLTVRTLWITICVVVIAPLCVKRQMAGVALASLFSIGAMVLLMLVICLYALERILQTETEWREVNDKVEWLGPNPFTDERNHPCHRIFAKRSTAAWDKTSTFLNLPGLLMGLPYFCSAFLCHFNVFSVFAEMRKPTKRRLKKVLRRTMMISGSLYATIAVCGFYFGLSYEVYSFNAHKEEAVCQQGVQGNILQNFPAAAFFPNVGRFCLFAALFFTYPLLVHPCRASLHRSIFGDGHRATTPQHVAETLVIMFLALLTAVLVPQVQVILGYAGSTFGILLAYVFPAYFVLRLSVPGDTFARGKLIPGLIFLFGFVLFIATTTIQTVREDEMKYGKNVSLDMARSKNSGGTTQLLIPDTSWWSNIKGRTSGGTTTSLLPGQDTTSISWTTSTSSIVGGSISTTSSPVSSGTGDKRDAQPQQTLPEEEEEEDINEEDINMLKNSMKHQDESRTRMRKFLVSTTSSGRSNESRTRKFLVSSTSLTGETFYTKTIAVNPTTGKEYLHPDGAKCTFVQKETVSMREKVLRYADLKSVFESTGKKPPLPEAEKDDDWAKVHCT